MERILLTFALLLAACGGGSARDSEGLEAEPIVEVVPERVALPGPPVIYDAEGNLLESDERLAGLILPVSLEPVVSEERRHVYQTPAPLTKVLGYFGPRLMTGQVDRTPGGGAAYRNALSRDTPSSTVHLDVEISPVPGATRIEIEEIRPAPITPPTEAEALEALQRELRASE